MYNGGEISQPSHTFMPLFKRFVNFKKKEKYNFSYDLKFQKKAWNSDDYVKSFLLPQ